MFVTKYICKSVTCSQLSTRYPSYTSFKIVILSTSYTTNTENAVLNYDNDNE